MALNWKGTAFFGLIAGLITSLLAWIVSAAKLPVINLTMSSVDINVRRQLASGMSTGSGDKLLSYISGYIPFTMPGVITVIVSSILIAFIGALAMDYVIKHVYTPKQKWGRMLGILLVGSIIAGVILKSISVFTLSVIAPILTLGLYYLIVTGIIYWIDKKGYISIEV